MSDQTQRLGYQDVGSVYDLDFHLTESEASYRSYLEEPYKQLLKDWPESMNHMNTNTYFLDSIGSEIGPDHPETREDIQEVMEEFGIDRITLNPGRNLEISSIHNDRLAPALASAYNDWVADTYLDPENGIYGSIVIAPHQPEKAAADIRERSDTEGFVSVMLPPSGASKPLGHRRYEPIYEALEETGYPLLLHNSAFAFGHSFPKQFKGTSSFADIKVTSHPMDHMVNLTNIITEGVPERHPKLTVVVMEAGLGWIPYIIRRLDMFFSMKRKTMPSLRKPPSEYIDEQFYFTTQPIEGAEDPKYVQQIVEWIGTDNLLFTMDFPHADFDNANELYKLLRDGFDHEDIESIYGGNAKEVLTYDE